MIPSEKLAEGLKNLVTMYLSDRILCDQSAIRLMVLETEVKFLRSQLQEVQNESLQKIK
jgi:hypothetical protein